MLFYYDQYSIYRQPDKSCKLLHIESTYKKCLREE